MKSKKILKPGQPGTKKWVEKYGEKLFCVRYRYDIERRRKMKTIELIVEESQWQANVNKIPRNKIINLRVDYQETGTRKLIRAAGGRWNREKKVWELPYGEVLDLGLTNRIIKE